MLLSLSKNVMNLVCTRSTGGDYRSLERWYSDHIHLLHACPELAQAQLFRCTACLVGQAPEYVCLYEFADWPAFTAFENSSAKQRASELTQKAAGRESIEIVQRIQYERVLSRRYGQAAQIVQSHYLFCCSMQETERSASMRWLSDAMHELLRGWPGASVQAYLRPLGELEKNLVLKLSLCSEPADQNASKLIAQIMQLQAHQSPYATSPTALQIDWATEMQALVTSSA